MEFKECIPDYGLEYLGIHSLNEVHWNLTTPALYEFAIRRYEGQLAHHGPLVVSMGQHTGRAAKDKYIVDEPDTRVDIWWNKVNVSYSEERFNGLFKRMVAYLRGKTVYVQDCYAGADPQHRYPVRVITTFAWHSIFVRNMFILPQVGDSEVMRRFIPEFTVLHCPNFHADSDDDKTRSGTFVAINVSEKLIIIGGTAYAGKLKSQYFPS